MFLRRSVTVAALLLAAVSAQDESAVTSEGVKPQHEEVTLPNGGSQGAVGCKSHCLKDPCAELNGNLTQECGACESTALCNPSADGFASWYERRSQNNTLIEEDEARGYRPPDRVEL